MDRMLRDIQVDLAPEREPRPALESEAGSLPAREAEEPPAPKAARVQDAPAAEAEPAPRIEVQAERSPPAAAPSPPEPAPLPPVPPQSFPPAPPQPERRPEPDPQLETLADVAAHLVASMRELLDGYERMVAQSSSSIPRGPSSAWARSRPPREEPGSHVTLSAGPFGSIEALQEFEHAVARLSGVRDVTVRGYQGPDRAIIEVRLDPLSP
jgi:hypothetical protein